MNKSFLQNSRLFWIIAVILNALVFVLNSASISQLYVYYDVILPLADSLSKGLGYLDSSGSAAFYPLWGYPILHIPAIYLSHPMLFTLATQFLLSLCGIYYFYKVFDLQKSLFHLFLLLPFIAIMSLKVPDAVIAYLLMPYAYYMKKYWEESRVSDLIISAVVLGLICNFRSEYILIPIAQASLMFIFLSKSRLKSILSNATIFGIVLLMMLPWAIRAKLLTDDIKFTSSNGGAVAYISLGQLSNNKWGIAPFDSTAFGKAKEAGIDNPYSIQGDNFFKKELREAIAEEPQEFARKVLSNFSRIFTGGVYTGEYGNLFIEQKRRMEINHDLLALGGRFAQFSGLFKLQASESVPILIEKIIQVIFIPIFLAMLLFTLYKSLSLKILANPFYLILLSIILYRIAIISFIQYEYRHVNSFYLIVLGIYLQYGLSKYSEKFNFMSKMKKSGAKNNFK